jgi:hypothetical protein
LPFFLLNVKFIIIIRLDCNFWAPDASYGYRIHIKPGKMKTITLLTTLVLTLIANTVLADNEPNYLIYNATGASKTMLITYSPVVPKAADFEDVNLSCTIPFPASLFSKVTPVLPRYADFDDDILPVHVGKLIPAIPTEADF